MFKRKNGKSDTRYKPVPCVIGVDQSHQRTGIAIAINGKLKLVKSIDLKAVPSKTEKRQAVYDAVSKAIDACLKRFDVAEVAVIVERIRTFTQGAELRVDVLKANSALTATIVDAAFNKGIETWSADTRAWKSAVLGSSKPIFEPIEGVSNPQKFGSVRKVIDLGFGEAIRGKRAKGNFVSYDDDAAEAACIALYGFVNLPKLVKEK